MMDEFVSNLELSEETDKIFPALIAAQSDVIVVGENADNHQGSNRTFKYADLGAVTHATNPPLQENGLGICCFSANAGMQYGAYVLVMHTSGQWIKCMCALPLADMGNMVQSAGGSLKYMRRYAILGVLNVITGEDDDGNTEDQQQRHLRISFEKEAESLWAATGQAKFRLTKMLKELGFSGFKEVPAEQRDVVIQKIKEISDAKA